MKKKKKEVDDWFYKNGNIVLKKTFWRRYNRKLEKNDSLESKKSHLIQFETFIAIKFLFLEMSLIMGYGTNPMLCALYFNFNLFGF